jgi:hypothetical protein
LPIFIDRGAPIIPKTSHYIEYVIDLWVHPSDGRPLKTSNKTSNTFRKRCPIFSRADPAHGISSGEFRLNLRTSMSAASSSIQPRFESLGERCTVEFRKQIKGLASLTGIGVGRNVGHIVGRFSRMFGEGMKLSRSLCEVVRRHSAFDCESAPKWDPGRFRHAGLIFRGKSDQRRGPDRRRSGPRLKTEISHHVNALCSISEGAPLLR